MFWIMTYIDLKEKKKFTFVTVPCHPSQFGLKWRKFGGVRTVTSLNYFRLAGKSSSRQIEMENICHDGSRGALIVLEEMDWSGKSSQCSRLVSHLEGKGISIEAWRFPDRRTNIGTMISSYLANESQLDDQAVHLLFSANRWEKRLFRISLQLNCVLMKFLYVMVLNFISLFSHYMHNAVCWYYDHFRL